MNAYDYDTSMSGGMMMMMYLHYHAVGALTNVRQVGVPWSNHEQLTPDHLCRPTIVIVAVLSCGRRRRERASSSSPGRCRSSSRHLYYLLADSSGRWVGRSPLTSLHTLNVVAACHCLSLCLVAS